MRPPPKKEDLLVLLAYFILVLTIIFALYMDRKGEGGGGRLRPKETAFALSITPSPDPTFTPTPLPTISSSDWTNGWEIIDPHEIDLLARTLVCETSVWGHSHVNGDEWIPEYDEAVKDALATGHVVRERADLLGVPFSEVLTPGEFTCWNDKLLTPEMISRRDDFCESPHLTINDCQVFLVLAIDIANGWAPNPMPGATHFYSRCYFEEKGLEPPSWTKDGILVGCTECHCFYKLEVM